MRALISTGDPARPAAFAEVPEPVAAPDQAVVAVQAFSLNRGDLLMAARSAPGWRLGWDVAGEVVAAAVDGSGPAAGTQVFGRLEEAGWAQRAAVPTHRLAEVPAAVAIEQAATLPVAGLTALRLVRAAQAGPGRRLLVTGAAGGVGRFLVQLAAAAGARVDAVVGARARSDGLAGLGAARIVTDIAEASGPYDAIVESGGGASLAAALRLIDRGGTVFLLGNSSGEPTAIDYFEFYGGHEGARLQHFTVRAAGDDRADLARLAQLVAAGGLSPRIAFRGDWTEINDAASRLMARRISGKAVLTVPGPSRPGAAASSDH